MNALHLLPLVIAILAVIQSIFGMGILVFGTPTLLLLGFDFASVLGLLLPASMSISLVQVWTARKITLPRYEKINMLVCGLLVVGLLAALIKTGAKARVDGLIGVTMLIAAAIRYSDGLREGLRAFVKRNERFYVGLMGGVHGLTNMGGALLAIYATSLHQEKNEMRATISRYYLLFGFIQLGTLALLRPSALSLNGVAVVPIAVVVYAVIGNGLFKRAGAKFFEHSMTTFIGAYGAAVLIKAFV